VSALFHTHHTPLQIPLGSSPVKKSSLSGAQAKVSSGGGGDGSAAGPVSSGGFSSEGGSEPGHVRRKTFG
jgi:hypothetical protein